MTRQVWGALMGRAVVAGLSFALVLVLAVVSRPPIPDLPKPTVRITQAFDQTGRQVTRQEWTERALRISRLSPMAAP